MKRFALCFCIIGCLLLAGCSAGKEEGVAGLSIALDQLTSDVTFIDYNVSGTAMQLIARLNDAGEPKLSYNTCQSCQGSPYAYFETQDGMLVCRNCSNLFGYDSIGETRYAGCMPIALTDYTVEDGMVVIAAETLEGMKDTFRNWKKGL